MPKEISHIFNALEVLAALQKKRSIDIENAELIKKNLKSFAFGSIAPDILYYDVFGVFKKKLFGLPWAKAIHGVNEEDTMAHLIAMARIIKNHKDYKNAFYPMRIDKEILDLWIAFAMGYLTHAAVDIIVHPVIYYHSGDFESRDKKIYKRAITIHRVIETVLDLFVLEKKGLNLNTFNVIKKISLNKKEKIYLFGFFALSLRMAYGLGTYPFEIKSSLIKYEKNIFQDAIYKTLLRSYKKQMGSLRFMRNRFFSKFAIFINGKSDRFSHFSSLFYPAASYNQYTKKKNSLKIEDFRDYRDAFTGAKKNGSFEYLLKKSIAYSTRLCRAFGLAVNGKKSLSELKKILKGDSLATGRKDFHKQVKMGHEKPLNINGCFKLND
ncbi:MAG: zinc dependent phospholipase C family protein [Spirochaetia bacterium]|nr:zinc dependent phospholipase C family protein [Spirochaetia bacterium]